MMHMLTSRKEDLMFPLLAVWLFMLMVCRAVMRR